MEHNAHNAIMMAYKCRMNPNLLEGKFPHSEEDLAKFNDGSDDNRDTIDAAVTTVRLGESDQVLPSELLGCPLWRANAVRLFQLHTMNDDMRVDPGADVSQEMKVAVNWLVQIPRVRFNVFRKQQISGSLDVSIGQCILLLTIFLLLLQF